MQHPRSLRAPAPPLPSPPLFVPPPPSASPPARRGGTADAAQAGADRCGPCVELVLDVRRPLARPLAADATGASSSEAAAAEGAAAAAEGGDVGRTGGTVVIIVIAAVQLARCAVAARCAALAEASGAEPAVQLA